MNEQPQKEITVFVKIETDCGYGFEGRIPLSRVKGVLDFSAVCIDSAPMALIAMQNPENKGRALPTPTP